jgi:hypothetical protein
MAVDANIRRRAVCGLVACGLGAGFLLALAGPARSAVPDQWGFAYVNKPSVPGVPDVNHQTGSWPAPFKVHVTPGVVGQVTVIFPQIATKGGVVHVTAVSSTPAWCQVQKWHPSGVNEAAVVRCFKPGGAPVFVPFSITFAASSKGPFPAGRAYGYVHFEPATGIAARFNSAGGANQVAPGATGVWKVTLPGLGSSGLSGNVQVTAVNAAKPAKCELNGWAPSAAGQTFQVRCFNAGTSPLDTGWTLTYHSGRTVVGTQPKLFAYTFDNQPSLPGPYAPTPAAVNFNSAAGTNSIRSAGTGLRLVLFPRVAALPNNVLVSSFKAGAGFCNLLSLWATAPAPSQVTVRDVACYTPSGALKNLPSLITYTSGS